MAQLLPERIDNSYSGARSVLWLFGLIVLFKSAQSVAALFKGHVVAIRADGIPIDSYPSAAAQTFMAFFALLAFGHLLLYGLCFLSLTRYRSMVPFMFGLLIVDYVGREVIFFFLPIVRAGAPLAPTINLVLFGLMTLGLVFSLRRSVRLSSLSTGAT
jgi:hypothetical protein